jgi:hypothetical protein
MSKIIALGSAIATLRIKRTQLVQHAGKLHRFDALFSGTNHLSHTRQKL